LGIKDVEKFNCALIRKWVWLLGVDKQGMWKEIILSKYGMWGN